MNLTDLVCMEDDAFSVNDSSVIFIHTGDAGKKEEGVLCGFVSKDDECVCGMKDSRR